MEFGGSGHRVTRSRKAFTRVGTHAMIASMQAFGGLPTRNFREVQFEGVDNINPDAAMEVRPNGHQNLIGNKACFGDWLVSWPGKVESA